MGSVVAAIMTMGAIGLFFSVIISVAYQKLKVEVDPRVEEILDVLPGANCGACGYPGCANYADAIVKGAPVNRCSVGGMEVAEAIARIMGVSAEPMVRKVARVRCRGDRERAVWISEYVGIQSCAAAHLAAGGGKLCNYGCLGFGDCERACPFGAIRVNERGVAEVDENVCIGCGLCVQTCPRGIITLEPVDKRVLVFCVSQDSGKVAKKACKVACIGCGLCAKKSPDAIVVENNCARVVDADKVTDESIEKCPTGAIVRLGSRN